MAKEEKKSRIVDMTQGSPGRLILGFAHSPHAGKCISAVIYLRGYAGGGPGAWRECAGSAGSVGMADLSDVRLRTRTDPGFLCDHFPEIWSRAGRGTSQGSVSGRSPFRCRRRPSHCAGPGGASGCAYVDGNAGGDPGAGPSVSALYLRGHSGRHPL